MSFFPTRSARRVGPLVVAAALTATLLTGSPAGARDRDDGDDRRQQGVSDRWLHSSDGDEGMRVGEWTEFLRGTPRLQRIRSHRAVPGLKVTQWDEFTPGRGPVRLNLISINLRARGLRLDYAHAGRVRRTAPLGRILARHRGVIAGVNGDFFDIGNTGAPLGLGVSRRTGLMNGRKAGWNRALYRDGTGWHIDELPMVARIKQYPEFGVATINAARVQRGRIGVYTPRWGDAAGYRVTEGQRRRVRQVTLRRGRVIGNRRTLTSGHPIRNITLIGRGQAARQLARLKVGTRVNVQRGVSGRPRIAITGNVFLIRDGVIKAIDDREMHPRTAVGIDHDGRQLLFLVVDGRQKFSRGYTMVELARQMQRLGADSALNLDGGGSSTMIAPRKNGTVGLINQPSDGRQRHIPNGIEIQYVP